MILYLDTSALLKKYLYKGMPPFSAPTPSILEPNTQSKVSLAIRETIDVINLGVY